MYNLSHMPLGVNDFATLRRGGYVYIDKTAFVHTIEGMSDHSILIRPHGFGRSLMISMLEAYYDIKGRDEWDSLFGDLAIGANPTENRSSYLVAHLDFGGISGNLASLHNEIYDIYLKETQRFCCKYAEYLPSDTKARLEGLFRKSPMDYLRCLVSMCHESNQRVYVFVDNYDCLVECVLRQGGRVKASDSDQIEGLHSYFSFFDLVKNDSSCKVDKLFAVGVVPITVKMDLKGVDIGDFYHSDSELNGVVGFNESDVRGVLESLAADNKLNDSIDDLIKELRKNAGGYCFSKESLNQPRLCSPQKVFSFIKAYGECGLGYSSSIYGCDVCPLLAIRDVEYDSKTSELKEPFGIDDIVMTPEDIIPVDDIVGSRYFISLLYYFGLLTIIGQKWDTPILSAPNETSKAQMKEFLNS